MAAKMASEKEAITELGPGEERPATRQPLEEPKEEKSEIIYETNQHQKASDILDGAQSLITVVVLGLCCVASFSSRLFAVIRFESIIHEFDPWYVVNKLVNKIK